ncbi:Clavaminate synthase-like protein [Rhodotorula sp. JG-1b]|nr:Clavaminate synthase-like protein [Rhodotorula sp. JG-1b]
MPHELQLPKLDISPFLDSARSDPALRQQVAADLDHHLTAYGFLYLTGLDAVVSQQDLDAVLDVSRAFFARPDAEKAKLRIQRGDGARGWQKMGENVTGGYSDWHEGWDCYKPFPPEQEDPTKLLHGPNRWPSQPANFRPLLEAHFEKMQLLGHALMEMTAMALGLHESENEDDDYARLKSWVSDPFWVARCIGYPPLPPDAKGVSCGAHKDYGNWTLLLADPTPGALQVFLRDPQGSETDPDSGERGTWINADPKPGCLVVNVGEMVEVYSAGRYKATLHRVIHQSPTYRVSVPFFFEPNFDATITPLAAASRRAAQEGQSETPGKPVHYGEFLAAKVAKNFSLEDP